MRAVASRLGVQRVHLGVQRLGAAVRSSRRLRITRRSGGPRAGACVHPFHPWFGRDLEFVKRRRNWRAGRVYVFGDAGELVSLPVEWTDLALADPFVVVAAGRAPFRTADLLKLADEVARLRCGAGPQDLVAAIRAWPDSRGSGGCRYAPAWRTGQEQAPAGPAGDRLRPPRPRPWAAIGLGITARTSARRQGIRKCGETGGLPAGDRLRLARARRDGKVPPGD